VIHTASESTGISPDPQAIKLILLASYPVDFEVTIIELLILGFFIATTEEALLALIIFNKTSTDGGKEITGI
jgi:hypothetical protein